MLIIIISTLIGTAKSFKNLKYSKTITTKDITFKKQRTSKTILNGWFDNFLPPKEENNNQRLIQYPEQYPATYELLNEPNEHDTTNEMKLIRKVLKQTQLENRPLQLLFDATDVNGWDARTFHEKVDGMGACAVLAKLKGSDKVIGGYNPKGWASLGGARPSVAAFLFYQDNEIMQKLQKIGGGGLACANDEYNYGISFGPDGLVIPLQGNNKATSKLGTYYERGPDDLSSLFGSSNACLLDYLRVYSGVYDDGEDIPYSGGVLDMTSG